MSVQLNHYTMIGCKFDYDEFYKLCGKNPDDEWEFFEEYSDNAFKGISHKNKLCIIDDGMSGEYAYIGHVISKSDNYGSLGDYVDKEKISAKKVSSLIKSDFGIDCKCEVHSFSHHS